MTSSARDSLHWQEEAALRDGTTLVVERRQVLGERATLDSNERTVVQETWTIPAPGSPRPLIWETSFLRPPEGSGLMLVGIDIDDGQTVLATAPANTLSYNHWGRPNPPYVFFRHDGQTWQRLPISEVPKGFERANVLVGSRSEPQQFAGKTLSVAEIRTLNKALPEYLATLVRTPITSGDGIWRSPVMVYDGKGAWVAPSGPKAPEPRQPAPALVPG